MGNEMVVHQPNGGAVVTAGHFRDEYFERLNVVKDVIAKGTSDVELQFFAEVCKRTGLDPFMKQIYCIKRGSGDDEEGGGGEKKITIQTGIDGYRIIAERTGKYAGQLAPQWCGPDGKWRDVWLDLEYPPNAARVGVLRTDWKEPAWGIALYSEYVQKTRYGKPTRMWSRMPASQLAKCAESLALRRAFPMELSGLYTEDEMAQSEVLNDIDTGGHPTGTKAAAQHVAQQKIQQLSAQEPAQKPAARPESQPKGESVKESSRGDKGADDPRKDTAPLTEEEQLAKRWTAADTYERLRMFGELKKDLHEVTGDDAEYYRILLDKGGVDHANQFKSRAKAWVTLIALFRSLKAHTAAVTIEPSSDSMTPEQFVEGLEPAGAQ